MEAILAYLEHQEYPEECSKQQKRDLRKRAADFTLNDGTETIFQKLHVKLFSTRKHSNI